MPHPAADRRPRSELRRKPDAEPRLSRTRKPPGLPPEDWQKHLRRQFGREQHFGLERLGSDPVFSEFAVTNPETGGRYRVAIRGTSPGENHCSCPDFATNDLGTCKHIEYTLARIEGKRGGKAALARGFHPPYSEIRLDYAGARRLRFRAGSDCPPALAAEGAERFDGAADGAPQLEAFLRAAHQAGHEVRCHDDARAFVAELRDAEHRRRALADAYPEGAKSEALLGLLKTRLYPYQAEGALFAAQAGRALIGDEMGLGKTIQAIAAAELLSRHCGAERVLIVCPTSLKHQWQREIERFVGRESQVIHGLRAERQRQYAAAAQDGAWARIANYETVSRDLDLIRGWAPDIVIVDEAQRIKNWNTVAARALKRIASPYAIVLTGTPLENRLEELISIVQFVDVHRLGPTWRLLHEHQSRDEAGRVVGYRDLGRIGATLAPILLRRRKAEVLEQLPSRIDNTLFVPMTEQQLVHHEENREVVAHIAHRWRRHGFLSDADQRRLTVALQRMRMSCNSTYLIDHETDHGTKVDELMLLLDELFEQPDAKAVIFSQWVRMHELAIRRLQARGWDHVLFHGGVPSDQRPALVDRFHADPACRVFLSTDAGGVGLNLQHAAATVINMDLPWNPAVLEQRIGRVHRLGQSRSVQVVNFVAQGTIEHGMLSVLAFKKSLFAGVLDGGETEVFMNGTRLSKFMESVEEVTRTMGEAETVEPAQAAAGAERPAQRAGGEAAEDIEPVEEAEVPEQPASTAAVEATTGADEPESEVTARIVESDAAAPAAGSREQAESPAADPWAPLIEAGIGLVEALARRSQAAPRDAATAPAGIGSFAETAERLIRVERDPKSGRGYLKLPVPEPQTVQRLAEALGGLLAGLRR